MANLITITNVHGNKCVLNPATIGAIVHLKDDTAIVYVGSGQIEVHKGVAEHLEELLRRGA